MAESQHGEIDWTFFFFFFLTDKEGLVVNVKTGASFGCSKHEIAEFRILCGKNRYVSRNATLVFRKANFDLFKEVSHLLQHWKIREPKRVV